MNHLTNPAGDPAGTPPGDAALTLTGERTIPGLDVENYWFRRHEVVYQRLAPRCAGRDVLEAGCGEGYGADLIADVARRVIGLDYDEAAVAHVRARYPRVECVQATSPSCRCPTPRSTSWSTSRSSSTCGTRRSSSPNAPGCCGPAGLLMVSTPNRITFSPGRDTPLNPFHTRELNAAELTELLVDGGFAVDAMIGVFHGPRLREIDARHGGSIIDAQIARALADAPWPAELLADVAAVTHRRLRPGPRPERDRAQHRRQPGSGRDRGATVNRRSSDPVPGLFTLVLHTHLPWLAHHGRWPVGEEWLYQSWAAAYLPLMRVLRTLAAEGRANLITLGITPVVAAQLDDPYCLDGMHHWLANWQLRAARGRQRVRRAGRPARSFGIRDANAPRPSRRSTTSHRCGGTAPARCCAS